MKLYHGSNIEIITPDLSKSKPYKDFGQGFYLSAGDGKCMFQLSKPKKLHKTESLACH